MHVAEVDGVSSLVTPTDETTTTMRKIVRDARLAAILDPTERAIFVVSTGGRVLHETSVLAAMLATDPQADRVRRRVSALARNIVEDTNATLAREWTDSRGSCELSTAHARYSLFAVPAGRRTLSIDATVMVDVERIEIASSSAADVIASHFASVVSVVNRLRAAIAPFGGRGAGDS